MGFETETTIQPVYGLMIDGSLSYIDFEYKKIADAADEPAGVRLNDVAPLYQQMEMEHRCSI
ncbi:hypothetical protein D6851_13145 [Altericroceibacterium spongiae]|uniref:Uncharacterized protein n=1 Tax=Altericroceibacterium spongiae TaxID=2320269 RepID=A0A420EFM9_9SPHN|nr:hypothetical protein [Altericroceibacterium spongiae]RKF19386.1 hypothetical protein D6851_13145 [Altericroceibacterium spongiae]